MDEAEAWPVFDLRKDDRDHGVEPRAVSDVSLIAVTRSFGKPVESWNEMEKAVAGYAVRAAAKLRRHALVASAMQVFLQANCFSKIDPQHVNHATFGIEASADSFVIMASAVRAAHRIWREGYRYAKAGVVLLDLSAARELPPSFFPSRDPQRSADLMRALDAVNLRFGRNTSRPGIVAPHGLGHAPWRGSYLLQHP